MRAMMVGNGMVTSKEKLKMINLRELADGVLMVENGGLKGFGKTVESMEKQLHTIQVVELRNIRKRMEN